MKKFILLAGLLCLVSCGEQVSQEMISKTTPAVIEEETQSGTYLKLLPEVQTHPRVHFSLPIIMYHYVEEVKNKSDKGRINLSVHPKTFEGELKALTSASYESYFVRDVPDLFSGKRELAKKSICLTFDDGYEDFYTDVFPLLKKYNMRGTLYVISDLVDTPDYVTKEQLKEIVASGLVEIGGHTLTHKNLAYANNEVAKKEIVESKKKIEDMLGITLESFAYPYGGFKPSVTEKIVRDAGFSVAVSVDKGNVHTKEKLYTLYRLRAGMFTPENIVRVLGGMKG